MKRIPCGNCQHVGYCDAFSEYWCKKFNRSLGYNYRPVKGHFCDVIGQDGDNRLRLLELLEEPA